MSAKRNMCLDSSILVQPAAASHSGISPRHKPGRVFRKLHAGTDLACRAARTWKTIPHTSPREDRRRAGVNNGADNNLTCCDTPNILLFVTPELLFFAPYFMRKCIFYLFCLHIKLDGEEVAVWREDSSLKRGLISVLNAALSSN